MDTSPTSPEFLPKDNDDIEIIEEKSSKLNNSNVSKNTRTLSGPQGYCPSSLKELLRPKLSSFRMSTGGNDIIGREPKTSTLKKSDTKKSELALRKKDSLTKKEPQGTMVSSTKNSKPVSRSFIK